GGRAGVGRGLPRGGGHAPPEQAFGGPPFPGGGDVPGPPGGTPPMSIVLMSLVWAHNQGRSSTRTCKWPTRGDSFSASLPNTGRMRQFSVRYWIQAMPRGSPSGSGSSTTSLGEASFLISLYGEASRTSFALCGAGSPSAPVAERA